MTLARWPACRPRPGRWSLAHAFFVAGYQLSLAEVLHMIGPRRPRRIVDRDR